MKKILIKLHLLLCFVSSAVASESLVDSLLNAKLSGDLRSYYFVKTYENTYEDASIWQNGVYLYYNSLPYHGFNLNATLLAASVTHKNDQDNRFYYTMDAQGVRASELNIEYKKSKTSLKVGRSYLETPYVKSNDSRLVKLAFQGVFLESFDLERSRVLLAYLDKFQQRTDNLGGIGQFRNDSTGNNGAYSIYFAHQFNKELLAQVQFTDFSGKGEASKVASQNFFTEWTYRTDWLFKPFFVAQYLSTNYEKQDEPTGEAFGGLIAVKDFYGLYAYLAYNRTTSKNDVVQGLGGTAMLTNGINYDAWSPTFSNTDSYKIKLEYLYKQYKFMTSASLFKRKGFKDSSETNFTFHYQLSKPLRFEAQYSLFNNVYALDPKIDSLLITRLIYKF